MRFQERVLSISNLPSVASVLFILVAPSIISMETISTKPFNEASISFRRTPNILRLIIRVDKGAAAKTRENWDR